jgi:aryl-alcohol dehydrogenase-like predicted oxidoreductase
VSLTGRVAADLETIPRAQAAGTAILDTTRAYTRVNEPWYAEALAAEAARGAGVLAGTKGGHSRTSASTWDADISSERIWSDVETSLRVFGGERLDLYYLHRVDLAEQPVEEGVSALASLRDAGKVARIGPSNVSSERRLEQRCRAPSPRPPPHAIHRTVPRRAGRVEHAVAEPTLRGRCRNAVHPRRARAVPPAHAPSQLGGSGFA